MTQPRDDKGRYVSQAKPGKLRRLLTSRRFWTCLGAVLVVVFHEGLGLSEADSKMIVASGVAWVLGDSVRQT